MICLKMRRFYKTKQKAYINLRKNKFKTIQLSK